MFCTMLTGLPPATGFAAPALNHALGEQPICRRAAAGDTYGDHGLHRTISSRLPRNSRQKIICPHLFFRRAIFGRNSPSL
eukprot:1035138-Prymnesium_polylepis.1